MVLFYVSLALLLFCSIGLLTLPFIKTSSPLGKGFFLLVLFFSLFSLTLYFQTSHPFELKQWLTQGKQHYELQQTVEQLGGIKGMIQRIEQKLVANPNDAEGWSILAKLYFADGQFIAAKKAQEKAEILHKSKKSSDHSIL